MSFRDSWAGRQLAQTWVKLVLLATVATMSVASYVFFGIPIKGRIKAIAPDDKKPKASEEAPTKTPSEVSSASLWFLLWPSLHCPLSKWTHAHISSLFHTIAL